MGATNPRPRGGARLSDLERRRTDDIKQIRRQRVTPRRVSPPAAAAGGGLAFGGRRLVCTDFFANEITTGSGAGNPWTLYRPNSWEDNGAAITPTEENMPGVFIEDPSPGAGFEVTEDGVYGLRYSIFAAFMDDDHCPDWVAWQCSSFYTNRPYVGVETMRKGNLTAAMPGSGAPGSWWEANMQPFMEPAYDPSLGTYLNITFQWPGIGMVPSGWSLWADLIKLS